MAETISMPKLGFDMAEGLLVRWVKQVGENINKGDVLAEIETDKATVEVESSASGVILQHIVEQGTIVPVNAPIAVVGKAGEVISNQSPVISKKIEDEKPAPPSAPIVDSVSKSSGLSDTSSSQIKASPLAKKIAKDNNINLASVQGSGPNGRIVKKDVESALSGGQKSPVSSLPTYQLPITNYEDKVIPTTKLRQAIGRRLVESKTTIPHFYVTHEYKLD